MSISPIFLALLPLAAIVASGAERVVCKTTVDTWVQMSTFEASKPSAADLAKNHATESELVIRGRESFALLQFDLSAIQGLIVEKATLRIHRRPDRVPLHTVGLSTVSGSEPFAERANFFIPGTGAPWSYAGSDLLDVTFAQGGSLYAYKPARDAGEGWYEVDVPPAIVTAIAIGDQFGLMLDDEKGQTQTRHVLDSRESGYPPVLIVEGVRPERSTPGPVRLLKSARSPRRPGSIILRFAGGASSYDVRYGNGGTRRQQLWRGEAGAAMVDRSPGAEIASDGHIQRSR